MAKFTDRPGSYIFEADLDPEQSADKVWLITENDVLDKGHREVRAYVFPDSRMNPGGPTFVPDLDLLVTPFVWDRDQHMYVVAS